jgi:uncharacterized membrane protein YozB (DUF420 family)
VGVLGTGADIASDLLILSEIAISLLVLLGVWTIRRDRKKVGRHRGFMLWVLGLNALFLTGFLVQDAIRSSNVVERSSAPLGVFVPLLSVHLMIAVSALSVAVVSWRIARKGLVRTETGWDLTPEIRVRHRRVSRYYPWLWGLTLATGLLLYGVLYVVY